MNWQKVGDFIKDNAGNGAALIGTLLTGGTGPAIAAAISMVSNATGTNDPEKALQALNDNPDLMVKLEEIRLKRATEIDSHIAMMELAKLEDKQKEHETTAKLIIEGQKVAEGWLEKNSRPLMAWASLLSTVAYAFQAATPDPFIISILSSGYLAWMGLRTKDKITASKLLK